MRLAILATEQVSGKHHGKAEPSEQVRELEPLPRDE